MVGLLDNAPGAVIEPLLGCAPNLVQDPTHSSPASFDTDIRIAALERELNGLRAQATSQENTLELLTASMASAGALHRNLCTTEIPTLRGASIHAHFQPTEAVGGDAYQVVRLDENRVAIGVIDATGHGVSGSLLAAYAQQAMTSAFRHAMSDPDLLPSVMMAKLNRDLCDVNLPDCQFVGAVIAIYDERSRVLSLARAGIPYPLHLTIDREPIVLDSGGPLLGAVRGAGYQDASLELCADETVVIFTDGLETALTRPDDRAVVDVASTEWLQSLRRRRLSEACHEIGHGPGTRCDEDDVTVITLHVS